MARPKAGYYVDGEPVPGWTTVCGLLNKPALVGWSGRLCTEVGWRAGRAGDDMPKWTEIVYGTRDAAAEAGTLAHELFDAYLRKEQRPINLETPAALAGWKAFTNAKQWLEGSALEIEPYEKPLVSAAYRFGGTPDALAMSSDGVIALCDWKTSAGVYPEMIVQMAGYRQLLAESADTLVHGVHLVRFSREHGDFAHYYYADDVLDLGWQIGRALLDVYRPLKDLEKRVR